MANKQTIINQRNGSIVSNAPQFADSWIKRLVGLLSVNALKQGESLWLRPCKSIHTIGMRFPIDVVFLDKENRIQKLANCLKPYRLCLSAKRSITVLELPIGTIASADLQQGDRLLIQ